MQFEMSQKLGQAPAFQYQPCLNAAQITMVKRLLYMQRSDRLCKKLELSTRITKFIMRRQLSET